MRLRRFSVSLAFAAALAACATAPCETSVPHPRSQGRVAGEIVDAPDVAQYRVGPGERYEQPFAHPDNAAPEYPAALLPLALPPVAIVAKLVVDAEGRVIEATPIDLAALPESNAMFASVRDAVRQWRFFPLVRIVAGAGKTTLRTGDTSTTYDGRAEGLPFSRVYKFTFTQDAGVGSVGVGGR